tara:strand:- start:119 stop:415 length:297 start_codon:yes stop_codon:yes gene_type:complete
MWFWLFWCAIVAIVFLIFYVRWLVKQIEELNVTLIENTQMIADFSSHLSSLYEMEIFYGDETLQGLLQHAKLIIDEVQSADLLLKEPEQEKDTNAEKD